LERAIAVKGNTGFTGINVILYQYVKEAAYFVQKGKIAKDELIERTVNY
jgi:hypothetical protein